MQWKLVSAFGAGAVLASGIVYFAVRPVDVRRPDAPKHVVAPAVAPAPPESAARNIPPVPPPAPVIAAAPEPERPAPKPEHHPVIREKPSPMPPPVPRPKDVVIAQTAPPPAPSPSEPAPAPVESAPSPGPAPAPQATPAPPVASPPPPAKNVPVENVSVQSPAVRTSAPSVTLAAGTMLSVRIGESLSSAHNLAGDSFLATLTGPLVIDGWVIAERGARLEGRVEDVAQAGRAKGVSRLGISLVRLATSDGQNIRIRTEPYVKQGPNSTGANAAKVGVGAAIGAIIGAIVGAGKGAAIGAGAGGAAGAGDVLLTRGKPAEIPVETRLNFRVQDSVTITERLD